MHDRQFQEREELREVLLELERSRVQERHARIETEGLLRGLRALALSTPGNDSFRDLFAALRSLIEFESAFVVLGRSATPTRPVVATDAIFERSSWNAFLMHSRARDERPVGLFDVSLLGEWNEQPHEIHGAVRSALYVPSSTEQTQAMMVYTHSERGHFGSRHVALGRKLALLAAQAIRQAELLWRGLHDERLATMGRLNAAVAHEINNPVSAVLLNLETSLQRLDEPNAAERREVLTDIRQMLRDSVEGMRWISNIVSDLRAFGSRGRRAVETIELNGIIVSTMRMLSFAMRYRTTVLCHLDPELPCVVGDRVELCQVIANLMVNAFEVDRSPGVEPQVTVTTRAEGELVVVEVMDNGTGVPLEHRAHIFEPFFTTKQTGTGIGLPLCQQIVSAHGGEVVLIETGERQGARFRVTLPARRDAARPMPTVSSSHPPPTLCRVLVVDDDPMVRRALVRALRSTGETCEAESGEDACRILASDTAFDLILCDLMMPHGDGRTVYEYIERRCPELLAHLVFCCGGIVSSEFESFLDERKIRCLEKPVARNALLSLLQQRIPSQPAA